MVSRPRFSKVFGHGTGWKEDSSSPAAGERRSMQISRGVLTQAECSKLQSCLWKSYSRM